MSTEQGIDTLAKEQLNLKNELSTLKESLEKEKNTTSTRRSTHSSRIFGSFS